MQRIFENQQTDHSNKLANLEGAERKINSLENSIQMLESKVLNKEREYDDLYKLYINEKNELMEKLTKYDVNSRIIYIEISTGI